MEQTQQVCVCVCVCVLCVCVCRGGESGGDGRGGCARLYVSLPSDRLQGLSRNPAKWLDGGDLAGRSVFVCVFVYMCVSLSPMMLLLSLSPTPSPSRTVDSPSFYNYLPFLFFLYPQEKNRKMSSVSKFWNFFFQMTHVLGKKTGKAAASQGAS